MTPTPENKRGVFAERIDHLIKTVHPKDRAPYTLQELADLLNDEAGEKLFTKGYLSQLRNGDRGLPAHPRLVALSQLFGVPISYFTNDAKAEQVNQQLESLVALSNAGVRNMALRAADLSPASLKTIMDAIELARRAEGLDKGPQD